MTHIADALVADIEACPTDGPISPSRIDLEYLQRIGVTDRIAEWQRIATLQLAAA
jgi:hypothetical protein